MGNDIGGRDGGATGGGTAGRFDARTRRRLRAVALALLVAAVPVVAGCGALSDGGGSAGDGGGAGDGGSGATAGTPSDAASRLERKFTASPETIFQRVEDMVGVQVESEPTVEVGETDGGNQSAPFERLIVGLPDDRDELRIGDPTTYSFSDGTVTVNETYLETADPAEVEARLVYEFARHLQFRAGLVPEWERPHHGQLFVSTVILTADAYAEQYLDESPFSVPAYGNESVSDYEWGYYAGIRYHTYRWVDARVEAPSGIPPIYTANAPRTGEQLLHGTDEPPRNMTLNLDTNERWYREGGVWGRQGEIGTRAILRTQLDNATAVAAAEGWGEDRYFPIQSLDDDAIGAVWVQLWDSPEEADEFETAMGTYVDRRRNESDGVSVEVRRVGEEATIVLASTGNMTEITDVSYADGRFNVTVGN